MCVLENRLGPCHRWWGGGWKIFSRSYQSECICKVATPTMDTYSTWLFFASQHLYSWLDTPWECSCPLLFVSNNRWLGHLSSKVYSAFLLQLSSQMYHSHLSDNIHTLQLSKKKTTCGRSSYSISRHSPINGVAADVDGLGRQSKHHKLPFSQLLSIHIHHYEPLIISSTLVSLSVFSNC